MGQYNKNTEILKSFFKKPLTLVISILFFSFAIISCIYSFLSGISYPILFAVYSLLAILPADAFLNLFIQGRRSEEINRLNTPLILMYIYTALSTFVPPAFFIYLLLTDNTKDKWLAFGIAILCVIFLLALVMVVLHFISVIITFHSIRKSANGIYLSRKGSVFMGITSFSFVAAVIISIMYTNITTNYSLFTNYNNIFDCVMLSLEIAILLIIFICLGIWSLMYSDAIQKATIRLHGTNKKSVIKAQTLADDKAVHQKGFNDNNVQGSDGVNSETLFSNECKPIVIPTTHDPFMLPISNEPNPYDKKYSEQKSSRQDEVPNHINFQNPYENFIPKNPFDDK